MREQLGAVIRENEKKIAWPAVIGGVLWEALGVAGNAALLEEVFAKSGFWEMLRRGVSIPPLILAGGGIAWIVTSWVLSKRLGRSTVKPALVPRTDEEIARALDAYGGSDEDYVIQIDREERIERTSVTVIRKSRRRA